MNMMMTTNGATDSGGSGIYEERIMNKIDEACKILDERKLYMNPETGSVDTGAGWIEDCTDPDYGFPCEELASLLEVRKTVTNEERCEWGDWMPVD